MNKVSQYVLIEETDDDCCSVVVDVSNDEDYLIGKAAILNEKVRNYNLSISRKVEFYNSKRGEFIKNSVSEYIPERVNHPDNKCWTEQDHIDWKKAKSDVGKRNKKAIAEIASNAAALFLKDNHEPDPESICQLEVEYYVTEIKEASIDRLIRK